VPVKQKKPTIERFFSFGGESGIHLHIRVPRPLGGFAVLMGYPAHQSNPVISPLYSPYSSKLKKPSLGTAFLVLAERVGFEPTVGY
jgi:hypothetical protein